MVPLTTRIVAIIAACIVMLTIYFSHWLFGQLLFKESRETVLIFAAVFTGGITYFISHRAIQGLLLRRIRQLYQMIHRTEDDQELKRKLNPDRPFLQDVENEITKFLKSQNQQLNTLRDLEKYRQEYVGNVAHELKTPIFNIQGYIHTLKDGALEDPAVNTRYLQKASDNVDRMIKIIEDLDSIYKLESNQLKLDLQEFTILPFVHSAIEEVKLFAVDRNIAIRVEAELEPDQKVEADPDYILQVFINLLENSLKYGNPGGSVMIRLMDLEEKILVEIEDDGPGIDAKHLPHLFDRFYRVDKARSRAAGGSGLGLSIVKHILEAHDETIKVHSTPGVGSAFSFTLQKPK
jgi:two-component system, OmpR family, phosphate regulon sensor histidine kinase PhoR